MAGISTRGRGILGGARVGGAGCADSIAGAREASLGLGVGMGERPEECECCVGGGDKTVNGMLSEVADVAKLSSSSFSSFSSTMSSGMDSDIRSFESVESVAEGASSERNRRNESGEMSLDLLPSEEPRLRRSSEGVVDREPRGLKRSFSLREEELAFRLKSFLGERDQPKLLGDRDRADLLRLIDMGALPRR